MNIGIYLAAGKSTRMGFDKRFLPFQNMKLGSVALQQAINSKLDYVLILAQKNDSHQWIDSSLHKPPFQKKWELINCKESSKGQSYSIKTGVQKAMEMRATTVMILLADQPFITTKMINTLIDKYMKNPTVYFVAAGKEGTPMPPILFSNSSFFYLMNLTGDKGARSIIRNTFLDKGRIQEVKDPYFFFDIDTIEDYQCILRSGLCELHRKKYN